MDGLITLFVIIMFVVKIFGKSKKIAKTSKTSKTAPKMNDLFGTEGKVDSWTVAQPTVREPAQPTSNAEQMAKRRAELTARFDEKRRKGESHEDYSRPLASGKGLAEGYAQGSMAFHSDEGEDVCDPTLGHGESSLDVSGIPVFTPHNEEEPLFSASDMVRGFVMSEILTRPGANRLRR